MTVLANYKWLTYLSPSHPLSLRQATHLAKFNFEGTSKDNLPCACSEHGMKSACAIAICLYGAERHWQCGSKGAIACILCERGCAFLLTRSWKPHQSQKTNELAWKPHQKQSHHKNARRWLLTWEPHQRRSVAQQECIASTFFHGIVKVEMDLHLFCANRDVATSSWVGQGHAIASISPCWHVTKPHRWAKLT